jgi:hypothetical protein
MAYPVELSPNVRGDRCVSDPGAPRKESPTEFCMVMIWKDLDALMAFVGDDYENAHIHPDEAVLVKARAIKHYELVEN